MRTDPVSLAAKKVGCTSLVIEDLSLTAMAVEVAAAKMEHMAMRLPPEQRKLLARLPAHWSDMRDVAKAMARIADDLQDRYDAAFDAAAQRISV